MPCYALLLPDYENRERTVTPELLILFSAVWLLVRWKKQNGLRVFFPARAYSRDGRLILRDGNGFVKLRVPDRMISKARTDVGRTDSF